MVNDNTQPLDNGENARRPPKRGLGYEGRLRYTNRCTAHRQRDGKPCGAWAVRGTNVCRIHGGMAPQVQRKAAERQAAATEAVAQAIGAAMERQGVTAQTAGRGLPAPWGERLKKALEIVEGRYQRPADAPRRATRPAGPPKQPAPAPQEPAEAQPERPVERAKPAEQPPPLRPAFAEPTEPPKRGLTTAEDALADVARANRRAGALSQRRRKRGR